MDKFVDSFTPVPDKGFYSVKDYSDDWRKSLDYVHKDKLKASRKNFRRNK